MKTILVTGGSGFFGRVLIGEILSRGFRCISLDIVPDHQSHINLVHLQVDLRDRAAVNRVFFNETIDGVVHCAAMLAHEMKDSQALWQSNVEGTRNLASQL